MSLIETKRNKKKILLGKIGLDGHDRGIKIIINYLRVSGYQVIYTGLHRTSKQIIDLAIQEDVDAIGISILSGSQLDQIGNLVEQMKANNIINLPLFVGGVIRSEEISQLKELGVIEVFGYGIQVKEIISWIDNVLLR
jgi:methylmalonyl-CoA mutase C-terminal domain/subunit